MFGKRIQNVQVYGDQTIYGFKSFEDGIDIPDNSLYCSQISDLITLLNNYKTIYVNDQIQDGVTTIAPSQNAVYDALVLKANTSSPTFSGTVTIPSTSS